MVRYNYLGDLKYLLAKYEWNGDEVVNFIFTYR